MLTVITIIAGTWLFALAAAATGIVKIFAGVLLPAIGGGIAAW